MITVKIKELLSTYNYYNIQIEDDIDFIDELNIDSLSMTEFITLLEKEFNIHISNEEITPNNFSSIICLEEFLAAKISNNE
jgi:acyl carrier protein